MITEFTEECGNRLLEGKNNLVSTRTQEKGAVTPQETDPDLTVSVQKSLAEGSINSGLLQGRGTTVHAQDLLEVAINPTNKSTKQMTHKLQNNYTK